MDIVTRQQLAAAEAGVTRLVKTMVPEKWAEPEEASLVEVWPAGAVEVRVRTDRDQRGQWVGSYLRVDAELVASRLAAALDGTIGRWRVGGEVTKVLVTVGHRLVEAQTRLEAATETQARMLGERDDAIRVMLQDADRRDGTIARIMEITGLSRQRVYQIKDGVR